MSRRNGLEKEVCRDMVARMLSTYASDEQIIKAVNGAVEFEYTPSMLKLDKTSIRARWAEKADEKYADFVEQELVRLEALEEIAWVSYRRAAEQAAITTTTKSVRDVDRDDWAEMERTVKEAPNDSEVRYWFDRIIQLQAERRDLLGLKQQIINVNMKKEITETQKLYISWSPEEAFPPPPQQKALVDGNTVEGEYVEATA